MVIMYYKSCGCTDAIHLLGMSVMSAVGRYMASLKPASSRRSSSVRRASNGGHLGGDAANPTPASQMYSQLSSAESSSALSWKKNNAFIHQCPKKHLQLPSSKYPTFKLN